MDGIKANIVKIREQMDNIRKRFRELDNPDHKADQKEYHSILANISKQLIKLDLIAVVAYKPEYAIAYTDFHNMRWECQLELNEIDKVLREI